MSPSAVDCADAVGRAVRGCRGMALVATLLILLIVSAIGLGLVLATSLEPISAANYAWAWRVRYGAEAGLAIAAHDLTLDDGWDAALAGQWRSPHLRDVPPEFTLPDGTSATIAALTHLADCGHEAACTGAELVAFTADRPWGPNNPRWQSVGMLRISEIEGGAPGVPEVVVVVWVGDDPADLDGNPIRDSAPAADGTRASGACVVAIRAEGFSARAARYAATATVVRPGAGCGPAARVVSWRGIR